MKWILCLIMILGNNLFAQNAIAFLEAPTKREKIEVNSYLGFTKVSVEVVKGMILVEAEIDGKKGTFILDTGAPRMVVNSREKIGTAVSASSFSTAFDVQSMNIKNFKWLDVEVQNMEALVVDISHLERSINRDLLGMIGYNALSHHEIMMDYGREELFIYPSRKNLIHRAAEPLLAIPFTLQEHLPVIQVEICGKTMRFGLDTGAGINLIDKKHLDNLPSNSYSNLHIEEIQGLDQVVEKASTANIHQTLIGQENFQDMEYLFSDLSHLKTYSGIDIDGLLGYEFFHQFRFSINYQKQKVYIWEFPEKQ